MSLLRKYPGPLFLDAHETLLHTDYFFPPNPDPIYHEIPSQPLNWIQAYGAAMAAEFDRQSIAHFSRDIYDLFYLGYSDTATTTGFLAAGMTFETGLFKPLPDRAFEHFTAIWTSLYHAAENKNKILRQWAGLYDLGSWHETGRTPRFGGHGSSVVFSPDGRMLAASLGETLALYDITGRIPLKDGGY